MRKRKIFHKVERITIVQNIKGMRLHDLRHTVVTYMLDAGESLRTVQEFGGHADPGFMLMQCMSWKRAKNRQATP